MKTAIAMISLSAILASAALLAQEEPQPATTSAFDVGVHFQRMDANRDGTLSRKEVDAYPRIKSGFDFFDANRDGGISLDEMKRAMAQWHPGQPQPANPPPAPTASPVASAGRVPDADATYLVMVCIDACRPDYLEMAEVPNLKKLMAAGVTYDQAWVGQLRNDTPPGHVTLATGALPARHGVIGFHWHDPATGRQFKPTTWFGVAGGQLNDLIAKSDVTSVGSICKQAFPGAKVAAFSSDKFYAAAALGADSADFIGYCRYSDPKGFGTKVGQTLTPETVAGRRIPEDIFASPQLTRKVANPWDGDTWTVDFALQLFAKERPQVLLINLALTDDIGHTHGANLAREQIVGVIHNADRQIGRLVETYRQAGALDRTLFVVTSDHGMSANLRTIDETPMAGIIAEYGMKRSAARLEFYVNDPAKAREAAAKVALLKLPGIHAVYHKEKDGKGGYHYLPAPGTALDAKLDACYRYLTSTYASPRSVDLVCFSAENWNIKEATSYFKGDHGTATWENQHIPLILSGPGLKRGVRPSAPARLVDIAPTLVAAMGLKPERMDGLVLADALATPSPGQTVAQREADARLAPLRDALRARRDLDVANAQPARPEALPAGPSAGRMDRNERWPVEGESAEPAPGLAARAAPDGMKREFAFRRDYTAGTRDPSGQMRTGQELMSIRAYRGQLFAATSAFTDPRLYIEGDPDYTGCQVLRKPTSKSEWQAEASFGKRYLRTDYLDVVRFTKDANGRPLARPVERLVASLWDVGEIVRDSRISGRNRRLTLAVRDDATGRWTLAPGPAVSDAERGFACIRSFKVHTDKVTGMEYLFVAAGCGGMHKCVYDPAAPGGIRWLEGDELDKSYGRGQSMCVANGDLYVSYDYGGLLVQNQSGGVFRRIDGPSPRWERVYRNYDPKYATWNQTGRGITAVPAEDGSGKEVVMVGIENPPEPILVRIEPHHDHRAVVELNYNEYFTRVFGRKPQMLGGSAQHPHAGNEIPALNRFDPFINPETGKLEHFVTLFLFHPDDPAEGCNNAYFLIRRAPGEYDWGEVTSDLPAGESLRGVRTIEKSPFPDEPQTYYFGGFFTGPDVQPPRPNLAWIFKGAVGARAPGSVRTAPPAAAPPPALYEGGGGAFSFRYPGDMTRALPGLLTAADARQAPAIVVGSAAADSVRAAVGRVFRETWGGTDPGDYSESNLYLGSSTGVAGNLQPGGRVGKRFTCRLAAGRDRPAAAAVGMSWSEGGRTTVIAVSYWGAFTEAMANVLLNKIIVSLSIGGGVKPGPAAAGGAGAPARADAGARESRLKSLDRNADGRITREEAGAAPWFDRLDADRDGVLSEAEIRAVRRNR